MASLLELQKISESTFSSTSTFLISLWLFNSLRIGKVSAKPQALEAEANWLLLVTVTPNGHCVIIEET